MNLEYVLICMLIKVWFNDGMFIVVVNECKFLLCFVYYVWYNCVLVIISICVFYKIKFFVVFVFLMILKNIFRKFYLNYN